MLKTHHDAHAFLIFLLNSLDEQSAPTQREESETKFGTQDSDQILPRKVNRGKEKNTVLLTYLEVLSQAKLGVPVVRL